MIRFDNIQMVSYDCHILRDNQVVSYNWKKQYWRHGSNKRQETSLSQTQLTFNHKWGLRFSLKSIIKHKLLFQKLKQIHNIF